MRAGGLDLGLLNIDSGGDVSSLRGDVKAA